MLQLLYLVAFAVVAFFAIRNLVRSLINLGSDSRRYYGNPNRDPQRQAPSRTIHPELLDSQGNPLSEPLLVMRSVDMDEAREKLDSLYRASPGQPMENSDSED